MGTSSSPRRPAFPSHPRQTAANPPQRLSPRGKGAAQPALHDRPQASQGPGCPLAGRLRRGLSAEERPGGLAAPGGRIRLEGHQSDLRSLPATDAQPQFLQLQGEDFRDDCRYNYDHSDDPRYPSPGTGRLSSATCSFAAPSTGRTGPDRYCFACPSEIELYTLELCPREGTGRVLCSSLKRVAAEGVDGTGIPRRGADTGRSRCRFENVDHQLQVMDGRQAALDQSGRRLHRC